MQHSGLLSGGPAWEKAGFSICPLRCLHLASNHQKRRGLEQDWEKWGQPFVFCGVVTGDFALTCRYWRTWSVQISCGSKIVPFLLLWHVWLNSSNSEACHDVKCGALVLQCHQNVECRVTLWPGQKTTDFISSKILCSVGVWWFPCTSRLDSTDPLLKQKCTPVHRNSVSQTSPLAPQRIHTFARLKHIFALSFLPTQNVSSHQEHWAHDSSVCWAGKEQQCQSKCFSDSWIYLNFTFKCVPIDDAV